MPKHLCPISRSGLESGRSGADTASIEDSVKKPTGAVPMRSTKTKATRPRLWSRPLDRFCTRVGYVRHIRRRFPAVKVRWPFFSIDDIGNAKAEFLHEGPTHFESRLSRLRRYDLFGAHASVLAAVAVAARLAAARAAVAVANAVAVAVADAAATGDSGAAADAAAAARGGRP